MSSYTNADLARIRANPDITVVDTFHPSEPAPVPAALVQVGIRSEHDLQAAVIAECDRRAATDARYGLIYAIPNGQYRKGQRAEPGLRAGVPDLFLPVACQGFHGLYLELKWKKNKPSDDQRAWIDKLQNEGYAVFVVWDKLASVMHMIEWYLQTEWEAN